MGVVALPLAGLLQSPPRFFRCRDTNKVTCRWTGRESHRCRRKMDE